MKIQSYSYLIASSLASGLIAFGYFVPEQVLANFGQHFDAETILNISSSKNATNPKNGMSAYSVQPKLMWDWGFPERLVVAASR